MRKTGEQAEKLACEYLEQQGLLRIERNYRCKMGEIDLIMRDAEHIVFVEVRYRRYDFFGGGIESVDFRKRQKLVRTAAKFLQERPHLAKKPSRFDIVSMKGELEMQHEIKWLKDAFGI